LTGPPWYRRLPPVTPSGRVAVRVGYPPRIGCHGGAEPPTAGTAEAADPVAASKPLLNSSSNPVRIGWRLGDASMRVPPRGRKRPGGRVSARTEEPMRLVRGLPSWTSRLPVWFDRNPHHAGTTHRATV